MPICPVTKKCDFIVLLTKHPLFADILRSFGPEHRRQCHQGCMPGTYPRQYLASRGRNVLYSPKFVKIVIKLRVACRTDAYMVQPAFAVQTRHRDSQRELYSPYFAWAVASSTTHF